MTNKERYQRTFSTLHASENCIREVNAMRKTHKVYWKKLTAACAAAVMVLAMASVAYAKDVGGIQRDVQIWLHGELTAAVMVVEDGEYTMTYTDENGETRERQGGGIVYDGPFRGARPMTADELLEVPPSPEAEFDDDGSVWLYYMDQKLEITDKFDEDGFCYVTVMEGDHPLYVTVKYKDSLCAQTNRYAMPEDFAN